MSFDSHGDPAGRAAGERSPLRRTLIAVLVGACYSASAAWHPAQAAPSGQQVVAGQASFSRQGNVFSITNTPNAIINWQDFSINAGEVTRFIQQNAGSAVLNRVVGQDPSRILGALQSNGRVYLINPNGILFGAGARVDVNGLVASSLALSSADFLTGKDNFTGGDVAGSVSNAGSITTASGGVVYLIAPNVDNSGVITAPNGQVVLAAGHTVQLVDSANPDLHVVVSAPADQAINIGQVIAQGGCIGIFGALVNQRGVLNADSAVRGQNGKIVLKSSATTLLEAGSRTSAVNSADGGAGGNIALLGQRVGLTGDAVVDASGQGGGGSILVGGDYQGNNAAVQNAHQSYVGAQVQLKADAVAAGNGGKIIVWSDAATRVFGSISARGGAQGGDGGLVETSGRYLDMQGNVDTRAPKGHTGTLLLDPGNVYIAVDSATAAAAGMTDNATEAPQDGVVFYGDYPVSGASAFQSDSLVTTARLEALLATSNATVTTNTVSGSHQGALMVLSPVNWSSNSTLQLQSTSNMNVRAPITAPNGSLQLMAPSTLQMVLSAALDLGGDLTLSAGLVTQTDNVSVGGIFTLAGDTSWAQNAAGATLPAFYARDFRLGGGAFTRVLGGIGTAAAPYQIADVYGLQGVATLADASFALANRIDASGTGAWNAGAGFRPIATYSGDFNGAGFSIDGLVTHANGGTGTGLFGELAAAATVHDLNLVGGSASGDTGVGALVGYNRGTLSNVSSSASVSGTSAVGGLVGYNEGSISQSYASGAVNGNQVVGGLVGNNQGSITNAYATGAVSATVSCDYSAFDVGGLVGLNAPGATIRNTYSTGAVRAPGFANVGGLVGGGDGAVFTSYWNTETSGQSGDGATSGSTGLDSAQMLQSSNFEGFQFGGGIWFTYDGYTTPMLRTFLKPLEVSFTELALAKEYDGQSMAYNGAPSYSGLLDNDTGVNGSVNFGQAVNAGSYTAQGLWSTKYAITYTSELPVLTITPRALVVLGSKVYDGTTSFQNVDLTTYNLLSGDNVALVMPGSPRFVDKNVGFNKAIDGSDMYLDGASSGNYHLDFRASITPATLTLSGLVAANKVYDGSSSATVTGKLSGVVAGDAVFLAGGVASFSDKNVGTDKTVSISGSGLGGADAFNYGLYNNTASTTASITPRALTVYYAAASKIYDGGTSAAVSWVNDDRVAGDVFGVTAQGSFADKNVGSGKAITVRAATLAGADAGNYQLVVQDTAVASANVTAASLTLDGLGAAGKVYDGTLAASMSGTLNGVLGNDVVTLGQLSGAFADKNVGGAKQVTLTGLSLGGADAGNYVVNGAAGTATADITQKLLSTWQGGSGLWSDAANWDGGVVPDAANVKSVSLAGGGTVTYSAAAGATTLATLTGAQGLSVTGGSLTLGSSNADQSQLTGAAGLNLSGGSLLVNGVLTTANYAQSGGSLTGGGALTVAQSFSQGGGNIALGGALSITQAAGNLSFANLNAASISLSAGAGSISQSGAIVTAALNASAANGITLTKAGNQVGNFSASNSGAGGIALTNTSAPGTLTLGALGSGSGDIVIDNTGGVQTTAAIRGSGKVALTAHSPVVVASEINASDISLSASTNIELANGANLVSSGDVTLSAGTGIAFDSGSRVAAAGNINASTATGDIVQSSGASLTATNGRILFSAPNGSVPAPAIVTQDAAVADAIAATIAVMNSSANVGGSGTTEGSGDASNSPVVSSGGAAAPGPENFASGDGPAPFNAKKAFCN